KRPRCPEGHISCFSASFPGGASGARERRSGEGESCRDRTCCKRWLGGSCAWSARTRSASPLTAWIRPERRRPPTSSLRSCGRRTRASVDGSHKRARLRYERGSRSPEGYYHASFDSRALIECLLAPLGPAGSRLYRTAVFDARTDSPVSVAAGMAEADAVL